jgi:hypothetical protein
MKHGDYIVIQEWMISELGLKGNELLIYALIYSFSRDGESEFIGSINYIEKWVGVARNTVKNILKILVEKELISKRDFSKNNVRYCAYKSVRKNDSEVGQILPQGGAISAPGGAIFDPNKYKVYKHKDKKEGTIVPKKEKSIYSKEFESDFVLYQRKGSKKNAYERWKKLSDDDKVLMRKHIPFYLKSNDRQYLKDFEGYINQRMFESPVTDKHGNILFDPDLNTTSEYCPNGFYVRYMENGDYYLYIGSWPDAFFDDGYKDEERPDGAALILNNRRGTLTWKSASKTWELTRDL